MFTGIIDHCGMISDIELIPNGLRLKIKHSFSDLNLGESVAIDGICLTVAHFFDDILSCDISPETLKLTTAKDFKIGQMINLERSLLPSSRMGGHFVTGHIDQILNVTNIQSFYSFTKMTLGGLDPLSKKFIVKKGSIAINGVSLTINDVIEDGFHVMLIPHTIERTNLIKLRENDAVNIEFDMLARMVAKQLENLTP